MRNLIGIRSEIDKLRAGARRRSHPESCFSGLDLRGFVGSKTRLRAVLIGRSLAERQALIARARRTDFDSRWGVNGIWGRTFAVGNRGLASKGEFTRSDLRQQCLIGWDKIGNALQLPWETLRSWVKQSYPRIYMPKWGNAVAGSGSSCVYIPKQFLALFVIRLYWGNPRMMAKKRFEMLKICLEYAERNHVKMFLLSE